jgi:hypothetical protein
MVERGFPGDLLRKRLLEMPLNPVPVGVPTELAYDYMKFPTFVRQYNVKTKKLQIVNKYEAPPRVAITKKLVRQYRAHAEKSKKLAEKLQSSPHYEPALAAAQVFQDIAEDFAILALHGKKPSLSYPAHLDLLEEAKKLTRDDDYCLKDVFNDVAVLLEAAHKERTESTYFQVSPRGLKQALYRRRKREERLARVFRFRTARRQERRK